MSRNEHFAQGTLPPYEDALYREATVHQLPVALVEKYVEPDVEPGGARLGAVTRSLRRGEPIHEPLHIVEGDKGPMLYDGHHRLKAAKKHGLTHVPVRVTL